MYFGIYFVYFRLWSCNESIAYCVLLDIFPAFCRFDLSGVGSHTQNLLYFILFYFFQLVVPHYYILQYDISRCVTLPIIISICKNIQYVHITLQPSLFRATVPVCSMLLSPDSHPIPNKNVEVSNRFIVSPSWMSLNDFNECCLFEGLICFMLSPQGVCNKTYIKQRKLFGFCLFPN